jgi:hypothetical protein
MSAWRHRSLLLVALLVPAACGPVRVQTGTMVSSADLTAALHPGATKVELQARLGPPTATGRAMMPFHDQPHETWTYIAQNLVIDLGNPRLNADMMNVFIFFDGDRVETYLWFNSQLR